MIVDAIPNSRIANSLYFPVLYRLDRYPAPDKVKSILSEISPKCGCLSGNRNVFVVRAFVHVSQRLHLEWNDSFFAHKLTCQTFRQML